MSHERVLRVLVNLGLTQIDAEVYVYLARQGPSKAREIAKALKMREQNLYHSLRSLQSKELVNVAVGRPAEFSAITFDKALEFLIKAHLKEAQNIEQEKDEILNQWHSMIAEASSR